MEETTRTWSKSQAYPATGDLNQHEKLSPLLLRVVANIFTKRSKINGIIMWIMTTDFSEHTPRQTRRVVRFTEPMLLTRSSPRADWRDAKLRGKTLFVVRHFVTLMAGTARACSAVFETCPFHDILTCSNFCAASSQWRARNRVSLLARVAQATRVAVK